MPANEQDNVSHISDYQQKAAGEGRKATLNFGSGGGTSGGMDGWQTSVEARLNEIKTDLRDVRTSVGTLNVSSATLTERIAHLPSKGFIITVTTAVLALLTAAIAFQSQIQAFLHLKH
jgi:hypothetical protein